MKITLIFPNSPIISEPCCEGINTENKIPYELLLTASQLNKKHQVKIIDAKTQKLNNQQIAQQTKNTNYAILWTTPATLQKDLKTLKQTKAKQKILIQNQPINLKKTMKKNKWITHTIKEHRAINTPRIIENKKPLTKPKEIQKAYEKLENANYNLINTKEYTKKNTLIITSFGCPHKCTFCYYGGTPTYYRSIKKIIQEIKELKKLGYKKIGIIDQNFTQNQQRTTQFCEELIKQKIKINWSCDSRTDTINKELLKKMKKAGCDRIFYGIEHINQEILNDLQKNQTTETIEKAIKETKQAKIPIACAFIIGTPKENKQTLQELKQFIKKTKPDQYHIMFPIPQPETKLYQQAKKQKLLKTTKTENYHQETGKATPLIKNKNLTTQQLINARNELQIIPRLNPKQAYKSIKDIYKRGGIKKVIKTITKITQKEAGK